MNNTSGMNQNMRNSRMMRGGCERNMRSGCGQNMRSGMQTGCEQNMRSGMQTGCEQSMRSRMHQERMSCESSRETSVRGDSREAEIPTGSRKALLCFINEVSFAVYESLLYLDTHPTDQEAMRFFREHNRLRNRALWEFGRLYGPLTIETANDSESQCWEWMNQPWPWEGGDC